MLCQLETEEEIAPNMTEEMTLVSGEDNALQQLDQQVIDHHLSFNEMYGTEGPTTIRLTTYINGVKIQALIDGGSTDSFIQPRVVKFLNLTVQPTTGFRVMVGNFEFLTAEGYIPSLKVMMQGYPIQIPDVYVVNVAGGDLVLGTSWLKKLGAHIVDYHSSFI